ncbi:MAG: helicase, partial [Mesorhizobium sp.]|nr:helicase [Mesorhizobium sp.]
QGGRDGEAGENRRGGRGRGAAPADAVAGEAGAPAEKRGGNRRERYKGPREPQAPKEPKVLWRADDSKPPRPPRPEGQRDEPRKDGPRRDGPRPGGRDKDRRPERFEAAPPKREERPGVFDPDSPFAKLAALRDQLRK